MNIIFAGFRFMEANLATAHARSAWYAARTRPSLPLNSHLAPISRIRRQHLAHPVAAIPLEITDPLTIAPRHDGTRSLH